MHDSAEKKESIAETFDRYFSVRLATSDSDLEKAQHIRFSVYCDEFGYEDPSEFPDRLERDQYDPQSIHALIEHRPSGLPAGCVRMVPTLEENRANPLPFEAFCNESLDSEFLRSLDLDRGTICEISRLAVDGNFRRRGSQERQSRFGAISDLSFSPEERRTLPLIAVSAYLAATAITDKTGYRNVFAMMEPFLPRLMGRSGIHFQRVGNDIEYHGTRAPYFITTESALEGMNSHLRELYDVINCELFPND